jgi:hypothetical protein
MGGYAGADYTMQDVRTAYMHLGKEASQAIAVTAMNRAGAVQNRAGEWVRSSDRSRLKSYEVHHIIATAGNDALIAAYRTQIAMEVK